MKPYAVEAWVEYKNNGDCSNNLQYSGVCLGGEQNMAESEVLFYTSLNNTRISFINKSLNFFLSFTLHGKRVTFVFFFFFHFVFLYKIYVYLYNVLYSLIVYFQFPNR